MDDDEEITHIVGEKWEQDKLRRNNEREKRKNLRREKSKQWAEELRNINVPAVQSPPAVQNATQTSSYSTTFTNTPRATSQSDTSYSNKSNPSNDHANTNEIQKQKSLPQQTLIRSNSQTKISSIQGTLRNLISQLFL
jgi:hypothetical protein